MGAVVRTGNFKDFHTIISADVGLWEIFFRKQIISVMVSGLSAPSPCDDLRLKLAIRLRGQTVRSDSFWEIGCDFSAVTIRLRLRCILR